VSAPTTHDPRFVNTKDGVTWVRRAVTQDGLGLYAVTGSCSCPEFLMATLVELAEHGIAGQADVLPVPVAPEPQALAWAHTMSDHDLHGFLDDLVSAAMGRWRSEPEVPDRTVLADIEKVCADWRTPGAGSRLDGSEFDGVAVRLVEPEGEFYPFLHKGRIPHDLPELGGGSC
jgi:hypothetical protein